MRLSPEILQRVRQRLLPHALDLRDGARTYVSRLGDDGGKSARMSRSSHKGLVQPHSEELAKAWRDVRVDLLGSAIERAFDSGAFVARTDAFNALSDHPKHADEFDRRMRELLDAAETFVEVIQRETSPDPLTALAIELKYREVKEQSWGGFGVLYRGADLAGVDHAIKLLQPLATPEAPAKTAEPRFRREAEALTRLSHPNIVKYQRLGQLDDGRWFLEMEFVTGETLAKWVARGATFEARLDAILQILAALEHAHEAGVFHRDIKPDNILVRPDGSAVLVDFGLAWLAGDVDPNLTTRSTWSLDYAPPEVREDPTRSRSPGHDIYSVGVVLHQILAGRRPSLTARVPLGTIEPRLGLVDPVIDRALADVPGRFASAAEFRAALIAAAQGVAQPWLRQAAHAAQIRSELLRDVLVAAADLAHENELETALLLIAGSHEALRIHWQREFRIARGSDAPRNERWLPLTMSPSARAAFPECLWLGFEPALGDDKHGAAALAALGFSVSDESNFRDLVEATHPLRSEGRQSRDPPTEDKLLIAHTTLVQRIMHLEATEQPIMSRFGDRPSGWDDDQSPSPTAQSDGADGQETS